jgi:hypothetical protein
MLQSATSQGELIVVDKRHTESLEVVAPSGPNPMAMLQMAVQQGADLAKLEKLMDLQDRFEKGEARKAFVEAMSAFKSHAINVTKDKTNSQYSSKYVSLGNLVATVTPFLSQHGLSVRWDIDQSSGIKVTCIVTHLMGHSEAVSMVCPPDKSGAKNPIQEIKSAITYGKACTFESICGLASTDANLDDDGNGGGGMDEQVVDDYLSAIQASSNDDELKRNFKEAYDKATAAKDKNAQQTFMKAKNARYKELHK